MPIPGFSSSEDDMRFAFGRSMYLATGWMIAIGVILLAMPPRRFETASWTFINEMSGGDNAVGAVYVVLGVAMTAALWQGRQRCMAVGLGLAGTANWCLGVFLLVGALQGTTGGIGCAMVLYPGAHMLSASVTLWHRHEDGSRQGP